MITLAKGEKRTIEITNSGEHIFTLAGEGAELIVDEKFNQTKSRITIIHDAPKTVSRVYSRGVLKTQNADSLVTVRIPKHAVQSDSYVRQRVLLLEQSRVEMTPSLEIETNEVKAGHAASVQPIDESQIFYLMSRGLSREEAQSMLIDAFMEAR